MQRWHGTGGNPALKPVTDDQIIASTKLFNESKQRRKIITPVGVAHDHIFPLRRINSACQSRPVSLCFHDHNSGTHSVGELYRTIATAVIGDDNFAGDAVLLEE